MVLILEKQNLANRAAELTHLYNLSPSDRAVVDFRLPSYYTYPRLGGVLGVAVVRTTGHGRNEGLEFPDQKLRHLR